MSQPYQLDCKGRACQNCGKCRDWYWDKGSIGYRYSYISNLQLAGENEPFNFQVNEINE